MMKLITPPSFSKTLFYLLFLLLSIKSNAQQLEYFKKITTNSTSLIFYDIKTDNLGNTFVALMHKGSLTIGTQTYACNNTYGNFILLKFDSNGNMLWSKMDGIGNYDLATKMRQNTMKIDYSNNVYIVGKLYDSANFSGTTIRGGKSLYRNNYFIVKYNSNGQLIWAKSYGDYNCYDLIENFEILSDNTITLIADFGGELGDSTQIDNYKIKLPINQTNNQYLARFDTMGNLISILIPKLLSGQSPNSRPNFYLLYQDNNKLFMIGENYGKVVYGNDTIYYYNSNNYNIVLGVTSLVDFTNNSYIKTAKLYDYIASAGAVINRNISANVSSYIISTRNDGKINFINGDSIVCPFPKSTGHIHTIITKINKSTNVISSIKGLNYFEDRGYYINGKYVSINMDIPQIPVDSVVLVNKGGVDIYFMEMDTNYNLIKYKTIASSGHDFMDQGDSKNNFVYGLVVSNDTGRLTAFDSVYLKTDYVNYYILKAKVLPAPFSPINLTTTHTGNNNVKLQWTDKSSDETKFRIYRSNSASGPFTLIDSVAANITIYNHLNSNTGLQYYQVCAVNSEGQNCSNISSVALGMKSSQTSASAFNIFPNPFNTYIEIQACGDFIATDISILNLLGEKVASESVSHQGAIKISTENLTPGIYFLKIITNQGEEIIYKIEK